ncbi:MAG: hypothetical protein C4523_11825 [Myxococcales bacterium]|nr:MAG: hypothetical protein C4523_11825 [Myxococcales bacterium]
MRIRWMAVVVGVGVLAASAWAEPLVRLDSVGQPQPALASSWTLQGETRAVFAVDAKITLRAAQVLAAALPEAKVAKQGEGQIVIDGLAPAALFPRLARIDISVEAAATPPKAEEAGNDVFAGLDAKAGDTSLAVPDGASSVRVTAALSEAEALARQFKARVVEVDREQGFPFAIVKLEMIAPPPLVDAGLDLAAGRRIRARPFFALGAGREGTAPPLDLTSTETRVNIGVWYLQPGDVVVGQTAGAHNAELHLLWLRRASE